MEFFGEKKGIFLGIFGGKNGDFAGKMEKSGGKWGKMEKSENDQGKKLE